MYTIVCVLTDGGIEAKPLGRPRVLLLIRRDISFFIVIRRTRYTFSYRRSNWCLTQRTCAWLTIYRRYISVLIVMIWPRYTFYTDGRIDVALKGRVRGLLYIDGAYLCFIVMIWPKYTSFLQTVVLMRNPKDVCVSYYHFYRASSSFGDFQGTWEDFLFMFLEGQGNNELGSLLK